MKTLLCSLALVLAAPPVTAGGLVLFRGAPGSSGDVQVVQSSGGSYVPQGLDGVRLLALDVTARSELERFLPGKAWLETDVPAAGRVVLPQRRGSVYHYQRDLPGGGAVFGYFIVDRSGDAWSLLDLPGTGPAGNEDPFLAFVAVAPDGRAMLVGSTTAGGGNLYEVPLVPGGGAISRTDLVPPQLLHAGSLMLADDWGMAVSATGVLRFNRGGGDQAGFLTYSSSPPTWWSGDAVLSRNGAFAAVIASDSAPLGHVWVFGSTGPAQRVSTVASALSSSGYLPDALHGPYLAVSDDGTHAAWRTEGLTAREAYLATVQPPPGQVPQEITSDSFFLDTLDEIGQYAFRAGSSELVLSVGALGGGVPQTMESADFFSVSLDGSGAPVFVNLTQTNGLAQAPFLAPGTLDPVAASCTPAQDAIVFHDDQGGGGGSLRVLRPGQTGLQTLVPDVKEVFRVDRAGKNLIVLLRRSTGNKELELHLVEPQLIGTTRFFTAPDTDTFPARAVRADHVYTFVQRTPLFDWMWAFDPRTQSKGLMTQRKVRFGPTVAVGPDDEVGFGVGQVGLSNLFASWHYPDTLGRLPVAPQVAFLLPGI